MLWFWIWEANGRCEAILRFQQDGSGRGSRWAGRKRPGQGDISTVQGRADEKLDLYSGGRDRTV